MKGFILISVYLMASAFIWYTIYDLLAYLYGAGDGLKAVLVFGWLVSIVFSIIGLLYYANSDEKLKEFFKKING